MLTYKADQLFRLSRNDEGYANLEDADRNFAEWAQIPDGTALDVGHDWMFHGVKVLKNEWNYRLPDGAEEYSNNMYTVTDQRDYLSTVMKMAGNWKGFAMVRNEEKYREILEKAEILAETNA